MTLIVDQICNISKYNKQKYVNIDKYSNWLRNADRHNSTVPSVGWKMHSRRYNRYQLIMVRIFDKENIVQLYSVQYSN